MGTLRYRLARWVLAHRLAAFVIFALITVFFAAGLPRVKIQTIFDDLLPRDDPFVQVYKDHPLFGSPLTVLIMVKNTQGSIYNPETLAKVWDLTRDLDLAPAVNHDTLLSITTTKARYARATPWGIDMRPLMGDSPPDTPEEIKEFKQHVKMAPKVSKFLISEDGSAAIISASFIEHRIDYGETFEFLRTLVREADDAQHEVYLTGKPILFGWVYHYEWQMIGIFAVTLGALILALVFYMRNLVGVLTPVIVAGTAAIWAFGFVGWLGISIEPLLMVIPLLLTARAFSHSVQFTERFYEVYTEVGDRHEAAETTMSVMMAPSVVSIVTDILGIVIVAAAPIDAMVRHAIFCGMWALWLIPNGVVLVPLLLSTLPAPHNARELTATDGQRVHRLITRLLTGIAGLVTGPRAYATFAVVLVASVATVYTAQQIEIGNPVEGSTLLWHDSAFNTAVRQINDHFPGVSTLEIVLEAKNPDTPEWTAQQVETVFTMMRLQRLMEHGPGAPRASLSFADYLSEANRLFNGGNPKWLPLDPKQEDISAATVAAMLGASSVAYSHVISRDIQQATVSLWYPDNTQETVNAALAAARAAVAKVGIDHEAFTVRLGTGLIALQKAVNRVVERYHWVVLVALNLFMLVVCGFAYRSLLAALILLVPVNLSNFALVAAMVLLGVGLDVNSIIVAAIGVGVGIDYGIYLLSRICEEYQPHGGDWAATITAALATTGKAIVFTATIMAIGILPWYFLSGLRFVADMGLLLVAIMGINMVLSLVVLPLLIWLIKPRFVTRPQLLVERRPG